MTSRSRRCLMVKPSTPMAPSVGIVTSLERRTTSAMSAFEGRPRFTSGARRRFLVGSVSSAMPRIYGVRLRESNTCSSVSRGCADQGVGMPTLGVGVAEGVVEAVGAGLPVGAFTGSAVCVAVGEDEAVAGAVCVTVVVVVGCALGVEERDVGPAATTVTQT